MADIISATGAGLKGFDASNQNNPNQAGSQAYNNWASQLGANLKDLSAPSGAEAGDASSAAELAALA